jgi:hypothetical protein
LAGRGDYDLCPVCWWEDEGVEPWEYSDPNGQTLVEARAPGWRPFELTDELVARVRQTNEEQERYWEEERLRVAQEIAQDPQGPFKGYNAGPQSLAVEAAGMSHREVKARMRELGRQHGVRLPDAYLELQSRLVKDEAFYRHHPVHAVWWLLRHSRPSTLMRRWQELRTGTFTFAA